MDVTPQTLREVEFRQALRGYNVDDVDEFLDRVASGIEIMQDRMRQANERAVRAEKILAEPAETDEAMRKTLLMAQRTADLAVQEARDQAARVLSSAEARARDLIARAEADSRRAADEAQRGIRRDLASLERARSALQADIAAFERHLEAERARVKDALADVIKRVDDHVMQPVPAPAPRPVIIEPLRGDDSESSPEVPLTAEDQLPEDFSAAEDIEEAPVVDDDPFLAELRLAATDDSPLGPVDDFLFDQDSDDDDESFEVPQDPR